MEENTLKHKATSGMVWTFIQKFAEMFVSFVSGIILARLLTPDDYGCIGMLYIFMLIAGSIVDPEKEANTGRLFNHFFLQSGYVPIDVPDSVPFRTGNFFFLQNAFALSCAEGAGVGGHN